MDNPYLQRRHLLSFESRRLGHIFTDVLVIGSGVAGLRAAIEAAEEGQVIVTTKRNIPDSNSYYAQGGIAAVLADEDSLESHVEDTLAVGAGLCEESVVRDVVAGAREHIEELRNWGVGFDLEAGRLDLGREGGHSANRIVHANGDETGRAVTSVLAERVAANENVKVFEDCFVVDLVTDPAEGGPGSVCLGALTFHPRYGLQIIRARQTILAAGGAGMLWRETTNPSVSTADAIALAFRAGATIADVEMMQFHPTTLYVAGSTRSLISEAVRGEGAHLVNREGERFMPGYHEQAELAPRDVVSRAIHEEMARGGGTHVYLDVRHLDAAAFAARFPHIDRMCRSFGIRPARDLIPVHPAAHYMIGGAWSDAAGRSSVEGLWVCGEAAATGLHGANRLASNSLLEALVFGRRCGRGASEAGGDEKLTPGAVDWSNAASERTELDLGDIRNSLRSVMWRNAGILRRGERLAESIEIVSFWGRYVLDKEFLDPAGWEVQNMLTAAYLVAECALRRTETRGVHYREDFPRTDPVWARRQRVRRTQHQFVVE